MQLLFWVPCHSKSMNKIRYLQISYRSLYIINYLKQQQQQLPFSTVVPFKREFPLNIAKKYWYESWPIPGKQQTLKMFMERMRE